MTLGDFKEYSEQEGYKLVNCSIDWADEATFCGFTIYTEREFKEVVDKLIKLDTLEIEFSISFGTNEENEYETVDDFLQEVTVKIITPQEAGIISGILGETYGHSFDDYMDQIEYIIEEYNDGIYN